MEGEIRSDVNEWVENQIVQIQRKLPKRKKNSIEKNMLGLFRYSAILYRCLYPYSNKQSYRVDEDLQSLLEQSICELFINIFENF